MNKVRHRKSVNRDSYLYTLYCNMILLRLVIVSSTAASGLLAHHKGSIGKKGACLHGYKQRGNDLTNSIIQMKLFRSVIFLDLNRMLIIWYELIWTIVTASRPKFVINQVVLQRKVAQGINTSNSKFSLVQRSGQVESACNHVREEVPQTSQA